MDLFDRSRFSQLHTLLADEGHIIEASIGATFDVEPADGGAVFLVVEGRRRYRAEVSRDDRLVLTGILDPDGPL